MNKSLFLTPWAVVALLLVVGFIAWSVAGGIGAGRFGSLDSTFLLTTGWVALAMYVVVLAYVGRKYALIAQKHPPANVLRARGQDLEAVTKQLERIQQEIRSNVLTTRADIRQAVMHHLRERALHKVVEPVIEAGDGSGPAFKVRIRSREPLGRVAVWMHAHSYLGVAAGFLVWLHGGGSFANPMAIGLNALSAVVIVTGIVGTISWTLGPTLLTRAERDLSIEKAHGLEQHYARKREVALEQIRELMTTKLKASDEDAETLASELRKIMNRLDSAPDAPQSARDAIDEMPVGDPKVMAFYDGLSVLVFQHRRVRAELKVLKRVRALMNVWRLVHVPASVVLALLLVVHVLSVWWY